MHMNDVKKIFRSLSYAFKGLRHAYSTDKSFHMEVNYGLPAYLLVVWYLYPLLPWEIIAITFSYLLILLVELVNTAFEKMLDRAYPERHPLTAASKDIASASVLVAFVFAIVVVFVLVSTRLMVPEINGVLIEHSFV
ncbi:MAG: hypothetical protein A2845_03655 [Candidatus Lloydbacteria bacterium RIFCSPHIGHO2_01_FULL_49_22]|uniref:Diacylglycerol kinase n=1 Tax=Candidatus Lloydbacteria bacterium RIFCSPHIGHO2_01_FULL_49_22 TaxID=1798658 RepID=A0A1G2CXB7_9BACT|nr:MAG: hypothetical protein A2845_03655 [Candidatus Lloydbacteria bacterium RIFCSPHIGHO2_01_FULL_49_22]OGZ09025.1 MAG: hypothetical protein A3C14_03490 [Candidatus Lloydbacteria bacterium RIFCSPHIGHO2_02_FULL_50_18]